MGRSLAWSEAAIPAGRRQASASSRRTLAPSVAPCHTPRTGPVMEWFIAPEYRAARFLIERGLGLIYLVAFLVALNQFPALLRRARPAARAPAFSRARSVPRGAEPVPLPLLRSPASRASPGPGSPCPRRWSLGLPQAGPLPVTMLAWLVLWVLYLSIVNVGQRSTASAGSRCCSRRASSRSSSATRRTAPPLPVLLLFRWLAFRVEFGAGLIKLRGDTCWRDLTCMDYHHETQPMPNPLSWFFHRLPRPLHRAGGGRQLRRPARSCRSCCSCRSRSRRLGALLMIGTQLYLVVERQLRLAQLLTIVIAVAALPDGFVRALAAGPGARRASRRPPPGSSRAVLALAGARGGAELLAGPRTCSRGTS